MIDTNLILVDGLPGSGKSTTAQRMFLHLINNGYDVRWYYEHETPHPIYGYDKIETALDQGAPGLHALLKQATENWRGLAESVGVNSQIAILDGALFQTTVGLLRSLRRDEATITSEGLYIAELLRPLQPTLIYFYQTDVAGALRRTAAERGEEFVALLAHRLARTPYGKENNLDSLEAFIAFFEGQQATTDSLYTAWGLRKLAIESSAGNWDRSLNQIAQFLGLSALELPVTPADNLDDFCGAYQDQAAADSFVVMTDDKNLYLEGPPPARLFHKADSSFYVEALCIELSFCRNAQGSVVALECVGNLPNLSKMWTKV